MADAKGLPNLQAFSRSPSPAQTLPSEAMLDALKLILLDAPLNEVLTSVTRMIEAHSEGVSCSVYLLEQDGLHLRYAAAANLPEAYRAATDGVCIGPNVGSCGAAAYLRKPVFVSDIVSHPNWANFRGIVLQSGLRAAWSTPIMSQDGKVLGTFCMYYREVRHPGPGEIQLIDYAGRVVGIAIERDRSQSALKKAFVEIRNSEDRLRTIVDTIPGFVCTLNASGEVELFNRQVLEYFGKTTEELKNWATSDAVHPDDLPRVIDAWRHSVETGQPHDLELRQRRADGVYRWFHSRALPARNADSRITGWYMLLTDIDDRKRAEDALRSNEQSLRLTVDSIPGFVSTMSAAGEAEFVSRQVLEYFGKTIEELKNWAANDTLHPDDLPHMIDVWRRAIKTGQPFDLESRRRRADGVYRWFHLRSRPQRDAEGRIVRWYNLTTDIDDRKRVEDALRRSEAYLSEAQHLSLTGSFGCKVSSGEMFWSEETFRIFGYDRTTKPAVEAILQRVHPEDKTFVQEQIDRATREGKDCNLNYRLLLPDGSITHVHVVAHAMKDETGGFEFLGAVMDVTEQQQARTRLEKAFDEIAKSEAELRTIVDAIPQVITVLGPDGKNLYANQTVLDYTGLTMEEVMASEYRERVFHPEDVARLREERQKALARGIPFENEQRARRKDGQYRWFLIHYNPLRDEQGHIIRWYATGTDIEDRKQAEERVRNENIALREEIDRSSMYEEIVGSSGALRGVISEINKVAPTDSTVMIFGETGTGKELIATAIHKRSKRSAKALIQVNCAAIPPSLIASELFGHEKGAFTGAVQRRAGRFESADGGTIFLDEIGELSLETQVALLRVLQEREFERVGSSQPISVDVRVLAATNRDLEAAVAAGRFRQDLFYRLNVFPIRIPSLRERTDDIPLLVEYLVERYAKKTGKKIGHIKKKTLDLFQGYDWPGNIRELQNVVERAVILCDGETFSVDETWLRRKSIQLSERAIAQAGVLAKDKEEFAERERKAIEAALAECQGRVSGPSGAAAKLGIPHQTLESKIASLGIDKHRFRVLPSKQRSA
jgi:PAS domain S-box-containing protein